MFTESSYKVFLNPSVARAMGAVMVDVDNDRDLDLYVANDSTYNHVLQNDGNGVFEDISFISGGGFSDNGRGSASMGVAAGDFNQDGLLDIHVTSYEDEPDLLFRNDIETLEDVSAKMGVFGNSFYKVTWGCGFADFDADGLLDLYSANGHMYPQVKMNPDLPEYEQGLTIYHHNGKRYQDVSISSLPIRAKTVCARGSALLDYDNDGDMDIVVNCIDSQPLLLENQSIQKHWLKVKLDAASAQMYGVRITAKFDKQMWTRVIMGGSGYLSQDSSVVHFGFGDIEQIDELTIHWMHQHVQTIVNPELNQTLIVKPPTPPQ